MADLAGFERVGHLRPLAMPGGVAAIREPWRMALAWLAAAEGIDAAAADRLVPADLDPVHRRAIADLVARGAGPVTSSMGRLFDAAAALLGIRSHVTYEAQAAIHLEAEARRVPRAEAPRFPGTVRLTEAAGVAQLDPAPLIAALRAGRDAGTPLPLLAAGFHEAVGRAVAELAVDLARRRSLDAAVLTGGVFQNARLTEVVAAELAAAGLPVLLHANLPCGDGGISIGQAAIAALAP